MIKNNNQQKAETINNIYTKLSNPTYTKKTSYTINYSDQKTISHLNITLEISQTICRKPLKKHRHMNTQKRAFPRPFPSREFFPIPPFCISIVEKIFWKIPTHPP